MSDIAGRDYVVCGLDRPLGDVCGWVGYYHLKESRYDDFVYTSVGYPGDVQGGNTPCVETGLHILDIDRAGEGLELETRRYPAYPGWSGGPLWADIDGGLRVVAVATSPQKDFGFDPTRVMHSGGGLMVDIIRYGAANFGAGPLTSAGAAFGYHGATTHHIVYRSWQAEVMELFFDSSGRWSHNAVSRAAGAPAVAHFAAPRGFFSKATHHVVYRTADDHVDELFVNSAGEWNHNILTKTAGAPTTASDPCGYQGPQTRHVVYRSVKGEIIELFVNSAGQWVFNVVSRIAGAPAAGGAPHGFFSKVTHHIVYRTADGQIDELFINSAGQWNHNILTKTAGAPAAASDPYGYQGPHTRHVVYRSVDGEVIELFINSAGQWVFNVVSRIAGAPAAGGAPQGFFSKATHHIVYRTADGQIDELFVNSAGQWNHNILTKTAGAPAAASDPYGYQGPHTRHVVYRSVDGEVIELFINSAGQWVFNVITAAALR